MNKYENTYIVKNYFHPTERDKSEMKEFWGEDYHLYEQYIKKHDKNSTTSSE